MRPFPDFEERGGAPHATPFRRFEYLRAAKTSMAGAKYPLWLSGVPGVQPFAPEDLVRTGSTMDLGDSLAAWRAGLAAQYGVPAGHVGAAQGTSGAVHLALTALLVCDAARPAVLVEEPAYRVFETVATLAGAEVRTLTRSEEAGYAIDLDGVDTAFAHGARVLCVTDLHNPTGVALSDAEVAALDEIARRHQAWVLVDEVYRDFRDGPVGTAYRPGGRIVVTGSFTKCCGLGPFRTGWIFADPAILERVEAVEEAVCGVPPGPWLAGIAACLPHVDTLLARGRAIAAARRPIMDAWLAATPHVAWSAPPAAGISGLVRVEGLRDSMTFARRLREELDVQVVPGAYFGAEGTIRVSFGLPEAQLRAALDVLALGIPPLLGS